MQNIKLHNGIQSVYKTITTGGRRSSSCSYLQRPSTNVLPSQELPSHIIHRRNQLNVCILQNNKQWKKYQTKNKTFKNIL